MSRAPWEVRVETRVIVGRIGELGVSVCAASDALDRIALVVDFRRLRQLADEALAAVPGEVSAGEDALDVALALARWLLEELGAQSRGESFRIVAVEVDAGEGIDVIATPEA